MCETSSVIDLLLAVPVLFWGGAVWTWLQARGLAVKLWMTVAASVGTVVPILVLSAMSETVKQVVDKLLN
jgi:hypothetical protein